MNQVAELGTAEQGLDEAGQRLPFSYRSIIVLGGQVCLDYLQKLAHPLDFRG